MDLRSNSPQSFSASAIPRPFPPLNSMTAFVSWLVLTNSPGSLTADCLLPLTFSVHPPNFPSLVTLSLSGLSRGRVQLDQPIIGEGGVLSFGFWPCSGSDFHDDSVSYGYRPRTYNPAENDYVAPQRCMHMAKRDYRLLSRVAPHYSNVGR